jgi:hypothetical protein
VIALLLAAAPSLASAGDPEQDGAAPLAETQSDAPGADAAASSAPADEAAESPDYDDATLNVVIPSSVRITIDPFEISGKGQIFSGAYAIKNLGDTDVELSFTDMRVTFANDRDFETLALPFDENAASERKAIYMVLDFGRSDIPPVVLTDPLRENEIRIPIRTAQNDPEGADSLSLSFSGSVNHAPDVAWQSGDVSISLTYLLRAVPPPEEAIDEEIPTLPEEELPERTQDEERPAVTEEDPTAPQGDPAEPPPYTPAPPEIPEAPEDEATPVTTQGALSAPAAATLPELRNLSAERVQIE